MFSLSGILILFATYASLLPDVLESKTRVDVSCSKQDALNYLSVSENWEEWIFQENKDETFRTLLSGATSGEGSVLKWFSDVIGDGALELKKINDSLIVFERITDNNAFRDRGFLKFSESYSGLSIEFVDSLDVSTNFMARYSAQEDDYIEKINRVNQETLNKLKEKLEGIGKEN